jgi:hypothetical protein
MARVIALTRTVRQQPMEALRVAIVCGCALALIAAHSPLPTFG